MCIARKCLGCSCLKLSCCWHWVPVIVQVFLICAEKSEKWMEFQRPSGCRRQCYLPVGLVMNAGPWWNVLFWLTTRQIDTWSLDTEIFCSLLKDCWKNMGAGMLVRLVLGVIVGMEHWLLLTGNLTFAYDIGWCPEKGKRSNSEQAGNRRANQYRPATLFLVGL